MNKPANVKVAMLVTDGFEQIEMEGPRKALKDAGFDVRLISDKKMVQGFHHDKKGDSFSSDLMLDDAKVEDFVALVLPGGVANPDSLRIMPKAVAFTKKFNDQNKTIAAICHGPWLLINAHAVKGKKVTSWPSLQIDLNNAGAEWVDEAVVIDTNLITSRNPGDIPAFNDAIIEKLSQRIN